jgi:Mg/Co/Ni transporter MgtE
VLAAIVVEAFEEVLKQHVQLSYFVPLLIGHGGNTGSQSNATVIRALALGHLRSSDWLMVVYKECVAGSIMGGGLGLLILAFSSVWSGLDAQVGLTVAVALPIVSCWANFLGGVFPLMSAHYGFNPAVTSAPLMTTVVDGSGLAIYFWIAKMIMGL